MTKHYKLLLVSCLTALLFLCGAYLIYFLQHIHFRRVNGNNLLQTTQKFERVIDSDQRFLVLGDSLAYGVGTTTPEASFAGAIASRFPAASITNKAIVGMDVEDLALQIDELLDEQHYSAIFVLIGGNDIVRYTYDLDESGRQLETIYTAASEHADQVYTYATSDFAMVSFVPWGLQDHFSNRSSTLHTYASLAAGYHDNVTYVDAHNAVSPEVYATYQAADGFHLNDQGIAALVDLTVEYMGSDI